VRAQGHSSCLTYLQNNVSSMVLACPSRQNLLVSGFGLEGQVPGPVLGLEAMSLLQALKFSHIEQYRISCTLIETAFM